MMLFYYGIISHEYPNKETRILDTLKLFVTALGINKDISKTSIYYLAITHYWF